jgi:predicted transposase YbfD/YdcC
MQISGEEDRPILVVVQAFASLRDPRRTRPREHSFASILLVTFAAVLCGAEGWDEIEQFGQSRLEWLRQLVPMRRAPSADVIRRVLSALDPIHFEACFRRWVAALCEEMQGEVVAIDGKTLRGSADAATRRAGLHLVQIWATKQNLLLGQCATTGAAGEPLVVPDLLRAVAIKGAIVTLDANGCTKAIAKAIVAGGADYVLHLKGNRGPIHAQVVEQFDADLEAALAAGRMQSDQQRDMGHGRIEVRTTWAAEPRLPDALHNAWPGLASVAMIERERTVGSKTSTERHYFLSSLPADAARIGNAARTHWSVENNLNWSLDATMNEDDCRIAAGFGAINFALIRRIALSLFRQPAAGKGSVPRKRRRAGWEPTYLLTLLGVGVPSA